MTIDLFRYDGKRVVVVGGATGMGASTARMAADLGAEVVVIDVAEVAYDCAQSIQADLRKQSEVDAAIEAIGGPVHAVFACAGVADGTRGIMLINFTSQRHLIERMVADNKLVSGGSVALVSSVAGLGWRKNIEQVKEFLACGDWATAAAWTDAHPETDHYGFSKEAINCYVAQQGFPLLSKGIRINAILPGPTDTPLARANADLWLTFGADYREATNSPTLQPDQMASTMIFLCSAAASGINGVTLLVDQGHVSASLVDSFDAPLVKMIAGEMEFDLAALGFE
ncbi:MAG: SDR family oxidoreductase [Acidimicrobiaceae bacterium]|nr:SDR family oxidoreductase [Acidimicrobiaceae bacterium]MYG56770.1 SDR family oxidoreductase [Acidimicrobiaceae bacterium]MYJ99077.1 SDR family oxidoreductase [Acidimicrobiaceae bacterium]